MKFVENVEKKDYQNFTLKHAKSHFLQSYEWGNFCKKIKNQIPKYIGVLNEDNKLIATALILLKKTPLGYSYGYCPRGFILDYNDKDLIKFFTDSIKNYMKKNKIIYIKFDPDIPYHDIDENANPIENGNNNYELYNQLGLVVSVSTSDEDTYICQVNMTCVLAIFEKFYKQALG